jgi:hypothetical protein
MSEEITRWRKKPVEVEARQLTDDNAGELARWSGGREASIWQTTVPVTLKARLIIPTLEGDHLALPGDWIIRGVKGEFYPCKPDIFEATYEPAGDAPDYRALVGKSTVAHWNVGLPGEQAIANAHRREAGLEELT